MFRGQFFQQHASYPVRPDSAISAACYASKHNNRHMSTPATASTTFTRAAISAWINICQHLRSDDNIFTLHKVDENIQEWAKGIAVEYMAMHLRVCVRTYMHSALSVAIFVYHIGTPILINSHDHCWHQWPTSVTSYLANFRRAMNERDRQSICADRIGSPHNNNIGYSWRFNLLLIYIWSY